MDVPLRLPAVSVKVTVILTLSVPVICDALREAPVLRKLFPDATGPVRQVGITATTQTILRVVWTIPLAGTIAMAPYLTAIGMPNSTNARLLETALPTLERRHVRHAVLVAAELLVVALRRAAILT